MMRLLVCLMVLGSAGCSLLFRFDEDTQRCDDRSETLDQCLPGFHCVQGVCVDAGQSDAGLKDGGFKDAGSVDGAIDAGLDAGSQPDGGLPDGGADGDH